MYGVVALSWSGSLFLSTLENYIPADIVKTKAAVGGTKFVIALPIPCVEWTSNRILGLGEIITFSSELPTNISETYKLNEGPKLKKPIFDWVIDKLQKLNSLKFPLLSL